MIVAIVIVAIVMIIAINSNLHLKKYLHDLHLLKFFFYVDKIKKYIIYINEDNIGFSTFTHLHLTPMVFFFSII